MPGVVDGHPSSSPPTRDPAIDDLRNITVAQARAAGVRITAQCIDGWHIPANEPVPRDAAPRIDWPQVSDDLMFLKMTTDELSRRLGVTLETVERIARGTLTPEPGDATLLTALWVCLTGKTISFIPKVRGP